MFMFQSILLVKPSIRLEPVTSSEQEFYAYCLKDTFNSGTSPPPWSVLSPILPATAMVFLMHATAVSLC